MVGRQSRPHGSTLAPLHIGPLLPVGLSDLDQPGWQLLPLRAERDPDRQTANRTSTTDPGTTARFSRHCSLPREPGSLAWRLPCRIEHSRASRRQEGHTKSEGQACRNGVSWQPPRGFCCFCSYHSNSVWNLSTPSTSVARGDHNFAIDHHSGRFSHLQQTGSRAGTRQP